MRVAVDTGGTFTDLIVELDDGSVQMHKVPTTPSRPLDGVRASLSLAARAQRVSIRELLRRTSMFIYGTTHALNAVVTGQTARTAFLTTAGHPDILVLREGGRPDPFDYSISTPEPYVPRSLTWEVHERILANGDVAVALDEAQVLGIAEELNERRVKAVGVCLLWSSINPNHEIRVRELLEQTLPGIAVSISSTVNPSLREYRRASATVIDASLKPAIQAHLHGLRDFLLHDGLAGRLLVVSSSGGLLDLEVAADMPIQMLNSGPAMAPVAGRHFAKIDCDSDFAIVADTGGTTYDVSVVRRGDIPFTRQTEVESPTGRHMTGYPSIDIHSVGAGGGSIAWVDSGGMLHVGPQSAGADPGPAAYGNGAGLATLTDACLVLGYLDPDFFLGGLRTLNSGASHQAVQERVAVPLGLSVEDAAAAIVQVATENMVQAIQEITVNQGIDPAGAVLIGGGGAAGLNSAWIARRLGVREVVIPELGPGLSACGALMSKLTAQFRKTHFTRSDRFREEGVNEVLESLRASALGFLLDADVEGELALSVEARYPDQVWEIDVQLPVGRFADAHDVVAVTSAFHSAHQELFGISDPSSPVEIVNWCATATADLQRQIDRRVNADPTEPKRNVRDRSREVYFPNIGSVRAVVIQFEDMSATCAIQGPAVIQSAFTTIVVPPGFEAAKTASRSVLLITRY